MSSARVPEGRPASTRGALGRVSVQRPMEGDVLHPHEEADEEENETSAGLALRKGLAGFISRISSRISSISGGDRSTEASMHDLSGNGQHRLSWDRGVVLRFLLVDVMNDAPRSFTSASCQEARVSMTAVRATRGLSKRLISSGQRNAHSPEIPSAARVMTPSSGGQRASMLTDRQPAKACHCRC